MQDSGTEESDGKTVESRFAVEMEGKKMNGWIQGNQYPRESQNQVPAAAK